MRLLALALLIPLGALAQPAREPLFDLVSLSAQAEREVANDLLVAVLAAEAEGPEPAPLADQVNRSMKAALEAAQGARGVRSRTGAYQTFPVYEKNRVARWRVRQELRLEATDFAAASALIGQLQASLVVASMAMTVSGEARREAENALMVEALAAFEERARIARDALKAKGYRLQSLSISGGGPVAPRPFAAMATRSSASESAPPALEPGVSRIAIAVSGTVQLQR
jgi:predicted secreted protein